MTLSHARNAASPSQRPSHAVVHAVRSTLLLSSIGALRAGGLFERYCDALSPSEREEIVGAIAGVWLPVETAQQHYAACDTLGLAAADQLRLGRRTGEGLARHLTRFAALLARQTSLTPWFVIEQFPRFWSRSFQGGRIEIRRVGPKDAELAYLACPLVRSTYFRTALRGVAVGLVELATRHCVMHEAKGPRRDDGAVYHVSWV